MEPIKKIGLYGIAANPPTLGHTHVIKSVLASGVVNEIWVIPTYVHFHGKIMAPYDIRVAMCEHAFYWGAKFSEDVVKIKKIEEAIAILEPEYDGSTTSMLENLRKHQNHDYRIIIGQDNAESIRTWKNGTDLSRNEKFIILPRQQYIPVNSDVAWYKYEPNVFLSDVKLLPISSTMARDLCKREQTELLKFEKMEGILSDWIIPDIVKNQLYIGGE